MTPDMLCEIRHKEQNAAAQVIGVDTVHIMNNPDGYLVADLNLRRDVVREIRRYKPDILVTCDPQTLFAIYGINHPDHRAAALAAVDAIFPCASMELLWPEEGPIHEVHGVYVRDMTFVDTWIDITGTIDLKIRALREHHSQLDDNAGLEDMIRQRSADAGKDHGLTYAEAFRVIKLKED